MSLSRFIGDVLQRSMRQPQEYEHAMRHFFEGEPAVLKRPQRRYPKREELYDRGRLR